MRRHVTQELNHVKRSLWPPARVKYLLLQDEWSDNSSNSHVSEMGIDRLIHLFSLFFEQQTIMEYKYFLKNGLL